MKIIYPSVELVNSPTSDPLLTIEQAGRTCYKSEDRICEGSAKKFVANIMKSGHMSVLEHGVYAFVVNEHLYAYLKSMISNAEGNGWVSHFHWTVRNHMGLPRTIISGNVRTWKEFLSFPLLLPGVMSRWFMDHPDLFPEAQDWALYQRENDETFEFKPIPFTNMLPFEFKVHYRQALRFICDRGVSHELVRHRVASFSQESTRYCNYSKDKFDNELTFIKPCFLAPNTDGIRHWTMYCRDCESAYMELMTYEQFMPQEARTVLNNSLKTEVIMTMSLLEWQEFFKLRCSPAAHPQMVEVATMARDLLKETYGTLMEG